MEESCALCQETKPLSASHIIPEFLYREMYDEKNRFHVLSAKDPKRKLRLQKGIYERLLCSDCETKLSTHERYASLVFSGEAPVKASQTGDAIKVQGMDYTKFRLFGLSILWRASVSTNVFFKGVNLGPHEPILRKMIFEENPGEPHAYGFCLSPLVNNAEPLPSLIVEPTRARFADHFCYRFVFGGIIWTFLVSSQPVPTRLREAFIDKAGGMLMITSEISEVPFIRDLLDKTLANHV